MGKGAVCGKNQGLPEGAVGPPLTMHWVKRSWSDRKGRRDVGWKEQYVRP